MKQPRWTPAQTELARQLIAEKATDEECLALVGRKRQACFMKLDRERHKSFIRTKPGPRVEAPQGVFAEADKRVRAPRSITAWVFGDPPPGYSALDRREQRA